MNILVYRWNSYNYIDIIATFQSMGHQVDVIEQELESYDEDESFAARLHGILQQKNYDFVFTVNYFAVISGVCQQMGIKYVSWSCDSPLLSMYHKNVFLDCNYFFLFDKTNYLEFKGMGVKHIWHLPLAVDTNRLDELFAQDTMDKMQLAETDSGNASKHSVRDFAGGISFVGNLYEKNSYDELETRFPEYLRGYFDAVMEAQLNISDTLDKGNNLNLVGKYVIMNTTDSSGKQAMISGLVEYATVKDGDVYLSVNNTYYPAEDLDSVIDYDYYLYLKKHANSDGTINKDDNTSDSTNGTDNAGGKTDNLDKTDDADKTKEA